MHQKNHFDGNNVKLNNYFYFIPQRHFPNLVWRNVSLILPHSETLPKPLMWLVSEFATFVYHLTICATTFSTQHSLNEYFGLSLRALEAILTSMLSHGCPFTTKICTFKLEVFKCSLTLFGFTHKYLSDLLWNHLIRKSLYFNLTHMHILTSNLIKELWPLPTICIDNVNPLT